MLKYFLKKSGLSKREVQFNKDTNTAKLYTVPIEVKLNTKVYLYLDTDDITRLEDKNIIGEIESVIISKLESGIWTRHGDKWIDHSDSTKLEIHTKVKKVRER